VQLHKRDVVEAATAILDNYGIADLTMRRLGRELNVSPGALYWHFANKQQLLGAIADRGLRPAARRPAVAHRRRRAGFGELRGRSIAGDEADRR
jgi:AcrR family transcriptional regulator